MCVCVTYVCLCAGHVASSLHLLSLRGFEIRLIFAGRTEVDSEESQKSIERERKSVEWSG